MKDARQRSDAMLESTRGVLKQLVGNGGGDSARTRARVPGAGDMPPAKQRGQEGEEVRSAAIVPPMTARRGRACVG
eukprot:15443984-Alexandrium_andersonii.AAC.1